MLADLALGQQLHADRSLRCGFRCRRRRSVRQPDARLGQIEGRLLGPQRFSDQSAASANGITAVGIIEAGIMGIGARKDELILRDEHLAVVGLGVDELQVGAHRHVRRLARHLVRQPALAVLPEPAGRHPPGGGVERIRVPQRIDVRDRHLDARTLKKLQLGIVMGAVGGVDIVGDDDRRQLGVPLLLLDQLVRHLAAERRVGLSLVGIAVVQEHVEHDELPCVADRPEHALENLLLRLLPAAGVPMREVGKQLQAAVRHVMDGSLEGYSGRKRLMSLINDDAGVQDEQSKDGNQPRLAVKRPRMPAGPALAPARRVWMRWDRSSFHGWVLS